MKINLPTSVFVILVIAAASTKFTVQARRNAGGSGRSIPPTRSRATRRPPGRGPRKPASQARNRRPSITDDYDEEPIDEFDFGGFPDDDGYDEEDGEYENEDDMFDEEYDFENPPSRRSGKQREVSRRPRDRPSRRSSTSRIGRESSSRTSAAGSRSGSRRASGGRSSSSGRVVAYGSRRGNSRAPQPSAFTRGLSALRESIPDASSIKDSAFSSIATARETTSKMSSNIYREIKGLTSSELEQVMLKATQPNDSPVKGKHVERLVGVTYQISGRYDIYDAVLRKLWSKMVEKDWRTTVKALYILHRFSADGAPDHQAALKARLRELRRTRDPKRKEKYFNSKQLLAGDSTPANIAYHAFLGRYAHYVLLRAQCFGGMFAEIANDPKNARSKSNPKSKQSKLQPRCITSTCLKNEHLEAAQMLLKAGLACSMKEEEECENTAIALERVVSDLIGLTSAVATALNNALDKYDGDEDLDRSLVKKWCEFYSEDLLPQTKGMVKSTSPSLDAYGLYLPSRMGVSVSQDLLQKGLRGDGDGDSPKEEIDSEVEDAEAQESNNEKFDTDIEPSNGVLEVDEEVDSNMYDEYEYDEYEYDEED